METTKLEKANQLEKEIKELEDFISLIEEGQKYNEDHKHQNLFRAVNLSAWICTGSDSPMYDKSLTGNKMVIDFVNAGLKSLDSSLEQKKEEFENMFK